jgi:hypothetical protein
METSTPGIFACGNVVHIHDLVDNVTREAWTAGEGAARLVAGQQPGGATIRTRAGDGIRYVVPHILHLDNLASRDVRLFMRATRPAERVQVEAVVGGEVVFSKFERVVRPAEMVMLTIPPGKVSPSTASQDYAAGGPHPELVVRITPRDGDTAAEGGRKA